MTLLDPNPNVVVHAAHRLVPLDVTTVEADVLKPLPVEGTFDSVALSYVLHCRRGAFDNVADTEEGLRRILEQSFQKVEIAVVGSIGHFTATGPR